MSGLGQSQASVIQDSVIQELVASTDETIGKNTCGKNTFGSAYLSRQQPREPMFYYFAYGSCMCPVDLKRSLGEKTHVYAIGPATLKGYRLGFYSYSPFRNSGVLDVVPDETASVEGVLYMLPKRLSHALDRREGVAENWYRHERISVQSRERLYKGVRTYVVVNKLATEMPPNDWYFDVVLRGAVTCGLSEQYCWQLFDRMYQLQKSQKSKVKS